MEATDAAKHPEVCTGHPLTTKNHAVGVSIAKETLLGETPRPQDYETKRLVPYRTHDFYTLSTVSQYTLRVLLIFEKTYIDTIS